MRKGNKSTNIINWLFSLQRYVIFFLLMSFVVTCCMLLFLNTMVKNMEIDLNEEGIRQAAKLTF